MKHFVSLSNQHRHWLRCVNDRTWDIPLLSQWVEYGQSSNPAECNVVPRRMHFHIHHHMYTGISGCSLGYDWWIISAESSWYRWRYDDVRGTYLCISCCQNVSVFDACSLWTWSLLYVRMYITSGWVWINFVVVVGTNLAKYWIIDWSENILIQ